jgi:hypothetical protein
MTLNIAHTMEETEIRNEQSEILCGDCRHELFAINHGVPVGKILFNKINMKEFSSFIKIS